MNDRDLARRIAALVRERGTEATAKLLGLHPLTTLKLAVRDPYVRETSKALARERLAAMKESDGDD